MALILSILIVSLALAFFAAPFWAWFGSFRCFVARYWGRGCFISYTII